MSSLSLSYIFFPIFLGSAILTFRLKRDQLSILIISTTILMFSYMSSYIQSGTDIDEYQNFFQFIDTFEKVFAHPYPEYGYRFMNYVGNLIGITFQQFFMLLIAISLFAWAIVIWKLKISFPLFISAYYPKYFFQANLNQIRSSLVYPGVGLSIILTAQKKRLSLILLIFILSFIHTSALLLFLIPIIDKIKVNNLVFFVMTFFPIFIGQYARSIIEALSLIFEFRYFQYINQDFEAIGLVSLNTLRRLPFLLITYVLLCTDIFRVSREQRLTAKVFLLSWMCYFGLIEVRGLSDRIGNFYGVSELILLCMLPTLVKDAALKFTIIFIILLYIVSDHLARVFLL